MAFTFAKEVLRALQDFFPLHQIIRAGHAAVPPCSHIPRAHGKILCAQRVAVASRRGYHQRMGVLATLFHATCLDLHVLG